MFGLRLAARRLAATPGFTLVATLTIGLAIGSATAIFALVDAVLLKPLPYADSERLLRVSWFLPSSQLDVPFLRPDVAREWGKVRAFAVFEPYQRRAATLVGAGDPQIVPTAAVGGGLMETLGVRPLIGRTVQPADARAAATPVAVIGEQLWRTRFGETGAVLGSTLRLDDEAYEIVGVMPARFRFPAASYQVWTPIGEPAASQGRPRASQAIARLRTGAGIEVAEAQMDAAARAAGAVEAGSYGWRARLRPFGDSRAEPTVRIGLLVLFFSVGVVLLIACGNLAGLMLVRAGARSREMAVRRALGATRARLVGSFAWEALIITTLGSIAGTMLTGVLTRVLTEFSPSDIVGHSYTEIEVDGRVFISALIAAAVAVLMIGFLPAFLATHARSAEALRSGAPSGGTRRQQHFRKAVVIGQVALSVALLVAAALLGRTLARLSHVEPGFDVGHVLGVDFTVQEWKYPTAAAQAQMFATLLERLRRVPGVRHAELSGGMPPAAGGAYEWRIVTDDGRLIAEDKSPIWFNDVGPEYFAALGMTFREGRAFTRAEMASGSSSIILGDRLARRLWPGGSATGHRLRFDQEDRWYTVVGIANDVLRLELEDVSSSLAAYYPLTARVPLMRTVVLRTGPDPARFKQAVRGAIRAVDPEQPIARIVTAEEELSSALASPRFYAYMMSAFAALAALLAGLGLYGVVASTTAGRLHEFGLRLAIGADPARIRRSVLSQGLVMAVTGALGGVVISLATVRLFDALLVRVGPLDVPTYAVVIIGSVMLSLFACWLPARRAASVDPATSLRAE
jgi:putative ABC transport system permease protein